MASSFDSNDSNDSNTAVVGGGNASGSSGGWFFADRVDLPFVTILSAGPNHKDQPIRKLFAQVPNFFIRDWAAEWYAWLVIGNLVQTNTWSTLTLAPAWLPSPNAGPPDWTAGTLWTDHISHEIDHLARAAQDERADALGEIIAESDEFASYFMQLLAARPTSYPATAKVLAILNLVGTFVAMHYKSLYQRPRPSQVCPALMPPLSVPGHASLPSGHSTQAHLMALAIPDILAGTSRADAATDDAWTLANRIARNREIAGLHYHSDTLAGISLAQQVYPLVNAATSTGAQSWFQLALSAANGEWKGP